MDGISVPFCYSMQAMIVSTWLSAAAVFALVWSMAILIDPQTGRYRLALVPLLLCTACWLADGWLFFGDVRGGIQSVHILLEPPIYFIGPFLLLTMGGIVLPQKSLTAKQLTLVFGPAAVLCAVSLEPGWNHALVPKLLVVVYALFFIVQHRFLLGLPEYLQPGLRYGLALILSVIVVSLLIGVIGFVIQESFLRLTSAMLLPVILFAFFLLSRRYPHMFSQLEAAAESLRYARSRLEGVDTDAVLGSLEQCMAKEKMYADEDLTLGTLASCVHLTAHQLSEFLNERLGKNFNQFVNEYRVAEARRMLLAEMDRTTLSIAYAVGFNSRSAFYRAFHKLTGQSPGKFREKYTFQSDRHPP